MKISLLRDHLVWGSSLASKIVGSKTNLPVLGNLLLTANSSNFLQIESSNLELSIRLKVPAKVETEGQVTVPARKFAEYLSAVKEEKLNLLVEKNQLIVEGLDNKTSFVTMPSSDFPALPSKETGVESIEIDTANFRHLLRKTVFATSPRTDQPVLTGVLFDFNENGRLIAAASDSFRLSVVSLEIENSMGKRVIIPSSALSEVDRLLSDDNVLGAETNGKKLIIEFSLGDNQIFFRIGDVEVISRLLEADFPDYEKIIPSEFSSNAVFDRVLLIDGIKTTSIFSSREGQLIRAKISPKEEVISLSAQSSDVGSHKGKVSGRVTGDELEIGFNSKYLLEGLNSFSDEEVSFYMNTSKSAVLVKNSKEEDVFKYQHIIMPMDLEGI